MAVGPALVTDGESAEAAELSQGALHHPAVSAQAFAAVHTASSNPGLNAALAQRLAAAGHVIALVVKLGRAPAGAPPPFPDRRHRVDQVIEDPVPCTLAAVGRIAGGMPSAFMMRCRFELGRPRSMGFCPATPPLFLPAQSRCPSRFGASRQLPFARADPGARG